MNFKKLFDRKWVALILIVIFSVIINQCLIDKKFFFYLNIYIKDIVEITLLLFIMILGNWGLNNSSARWVNSIWKITYLSSIAFFITMSLVDNLVFNYSTTRQFRFFGVKQILWNPLVYLMLVLLSIRFEKQRN